MIFKVSSCIIHGKKSLFVYLQFATNRMSISLKMRSWELVENGSLFRNTLYCCKSWIIYFVWKEYNHELFLSVYQFCIVFYLTYTWQCLCFMSSSDIFALNIKYLNLELLALYSTLVYISNTEKRDSTSGEEEEWVVDQHHISELKEQYKKERKGKKNSKCCPAFHFSCMHFQYFHVEF